MEIPGGMGEVEVTIDYTYDPLYRLTAADYDDGTYFHYTYDAVGNRLTEETDESTSTYTHDIANRLTNVDGVVYTWDANGNLLSDGTGTYTYDAANRLVGLVQGDDTYAYTYNGFGDRLSQTINGETTNYTLDIDTYLTEVLQDGTSTYLYGLGRIGEDRGDTTLYHLPDAVGSVRQLADSESQILFAQSYEPFGDELETYSADGSTYGFTGQMVDENGLVYLRARYYDSGTGRFFTKDPWSGSPTQPMSYDPYLYAYNNPVLYTDPSGDQPLLGFALIMFGLGALVVEVNQIQEYADDHGMSFHDALTDAHTYLDQGRMIEAGINTSFFAVTVIEGVAFILLGTAILSQQGAITFLDTGLWEFGLQCQSAAESWTSIWWQGGMPSIGSPELPGPSGLGNYGTELIEMPGEWGNTRSSNDYEELVRQHLNNPSNLSPEYNGKSFDAWNYEDGAFVDAKRSIGDWFTTNLASGVIQHRNDEIYDTAIREIEAAGGIPVQWWTNTDASANFLENFFVEYGLDIDVIKWP